MRSLSSPLLAAQKADVLRPHLGNVYVKDLQAEVARLHWSLLYSQGGSDMLASMWAAADGNFVRVRATPTNNLYRQRITNPTGSWGGWTLVSMSMSSSVRPWVFGYGANLYILVLGVDGYTVRCWESTDYGATFPVVGTVCSEAGVVVQGVAGAVNWNDGSAKVFVAANPGGSEAQAFLRKYDRTGPASWGPASAWGKTSWYSFSGLTCWFSGDFNLVATGRGPAEGPVGEYPWQMAGLAFGAGFDVSLGAWSDPVVMRKSDLSAPFEYHHPSLCQADVFRLTFVENYTGPGAYTRLMQAHRPSAEGFRPGEWVTAIPLADSSYGRSLAYQSGGYVYLCDGDDVWRAQMVGEGFCVDVRDRVLGYKATDGGGPGRPGGVILELRNDDGALAAMGQAGQPFAAMKRGAVLQISRGYVTPLGGEAVSRPDATIESIEHLIQAGVAKVRLHCLDGWGLLQGWRAERQYTWEATHTTDALAGAVLAFAGMDCLRSGLPSPESQWRPNFTIQPGESGASALGRLLRMMPEEIHWYDHHAVLVWLQEGEASCYSYGGAGEHQIRSAGFENGSLEAGQIQVFGASGSYGDALDYAEFDLSGARLAKVIDYSLASSAACATRAESLLEVNRQKAAGGFVEVAPNVGQEVWDQVAVTVSAAGMTAAKRRVAQIVEEYRAEGGVFRQRLVFGSWKV